MANASFELREFASLRMRVVICAALGCTEVVEGEGRLLESCAGLLCGEKSVHADIPAWGAKQTEEDGVVLRGATIEVLPRNST